MRTAGQGQVAVPWERGLRRREATDLPWFSWDVGEYLTDCHDYLVERCHFSLGNVCFWALCMSAYFCCPCAQCALFNRREKK